MAIKMQVKIEGENCYSRVGEILVFTLISECRKRKFYTSICQLTIKICNFRVKNRWEFTFLIDLYPT